jgi:hypothetical protein
VPLWRRMWTRECTHVDAVHFSAWTLITHAWDSHLGGHVLAVGAQHALCHIYAEALCSRWGMEYDTGHGICSCTHLAHTHRRHSPAPGTFPPHATPIPHPTQLKAPCTLTLVPPPVPAATPLPVHPHPATATWPWNQATKERAASPPLVVKRKGKGGRGGGEAAPVSRRRPSRSNSRAGAMLLRRPGRRGRWRGRRGRWRGLAARCSDDVGDGGQ